MGIRVTAAEILFKPLHEPGVIGLRPATREALAQADAADTTEPTEIIEAKHSILGSR